MRLALMAAILALAPAPLFAGSFDLSLDDTNGERIVVVARSGGGAVAVAAGSEDLKIQRGEDADRALASLTKVSADADDKARPAEGGKRKKLKKIVIHKMEIDEDPADDEASREVRILKKRDGERREEKLLFENDNFLIGSDAEGASAVERRVIRMKGVDETRAIKFIDETAGLDAGEKAEMKRLVGL